MAYNPYTAASKITEAKKGYVNAKATGKDTGEYETEAAKYYDELRNNGRADIANHLQTLDAVSAEDYINQLKPADYTYSAVAQKSNKVHDTGVEYGNKISDTYDKVYDNQINVNPTSTGYGKDIMQGFGVKAGEAYKSALGNNAANNGGNVDSYAAAQAGRSMNDTMAQGYDTVLDYYNTLAGNANNWAAGKAGALNDNLSLLQDNVKADADTVNTRHSIDSNERLGALNAAADVMASVNEAAVEKYGYDVNAQVAAGDSLVEGYTKMAASGINPDAYAGNMAGLMPSVTPPSAPSTSGVEDLYAYYKALNIPEGIVGDGSTTYVPVVFNTAASSASGGASGAVIDDAGVPAAADTSSDGVGGDGTQQDSNWGVKYDDNGNPYYLTNEDGSLRVMSDDEFATQVNSGRAASGANGDLYYASGDLYKRLDDGRLVQIDDDMILDVWNVAAGYPDEYGPKVRKMGGGGRTYNPDRVDDMSAYSEAFNTVITDTPADVQTYTNANGTAPVPKPGAANTDTSEAGGNTGGSSKGTTGGSSTGTTNNPSKGTTGGTDSKSSSTNASNEGGGKDNDINAVDYNALLNDVALSGINADGKLARILSMYESGLKEETVKRLMDDSGIDSSLYFD